MFERLFENVPHEVRKKLEGQMESAILEGVGKVRKGSVDVLACVVRLSEIMLLAGALGHSTRSRAKKSGEGRSDGTDADDRSTEGP
jgi:hypothetical protein